MIFTAMNTARFAKSIAERYGAQDMQQEAISDLTTNDSRRSIDLANIQLSKEQVALLKPLKSVFNVAPLSLHEHVKELVSGQLLVLTKEDASSIGAYLQEVAKTTKGDSFAVLNRIANDLSKIHGSI